jgi:hypothetical protein
MSFETFCALVKLPCRWCGRTPERANGMGVDRKNNNVGHTETNTTPCCAICNMAKGPRTEEEFSLYLEDLIAFHS